MGEVNGIKISTDFSLKEFESPDTHEVMIDPELVDYAQKLRDLVGGPVMVESGYRTPEHNAAVHGSPNSYHMRGQALDCWTVGVTLLELALAAVQAGFSSVIIERVKSIVHCALGPQQQLIVPAESYDEAKRAVVPADFPVFKYEVVFPN